MKQKYWILYEQSECPSCGMIFSKHQTRMYTEKPKDPYKRYKTTLYGCTACSSGNW